MPQIVWQDAHSILAIRDDMLKKSPFFEFLNRRARPSFDEFLATGVEESDYIDWNGYLLANDYGDAEFEYRAIRNECAVFDVSPLRKTRITGSGAGEFLDRLLTRRASVIPPMRAAYCVFCDDEGYLKDDAILYKFAEGDFLLMPSDIDHIPYFRSLCQRFALSDVQFRECTSAWAGLAVQGPLSASVLDAMQFAGVEFLRPFESRYFSIDGAEILIARMGFTADLGYECWFTPDSVDRFRDRLRSARDALSIPVPGYGLDALQACRLEGGFIVAGWDCSTEIEPQAGFERTPMELGLDWLVNLDDTEFVGRNALLAKRAVGPRHVLRYVSLDEELAIPDGAPLYDSSDVTRQIVGSISCSNWSWGLNALIGNASMLSEFASLVIAFVKIDGVWHRATLSERAHVDLQRRNATPAALP